MLLPAEQLFNGTWGGAIPEEVQDYLMCKAFGWTWRELMDTPLYVRRTFWHLMELQAKAEQDRFDKKGKKGHQHA